MRALQGALVASLIACASVARADEDAPALLLRAFELRRDHKNVEALAVYEQVYALTPTSAVRAQRALAHQALGHWLAAERDLDAALGSEDAWVARNRAALDEARGVVRGHLAWLTVDVDTEGATVQLDGETLSPGKEERVASGVGLLEVRAVGRVPEIRRVLLAPSEHVRETIALPPLIATAASPIAPALVPEQQATPPPTPQDAPGPPPGETAGAPILPIVVGATGLAVLATGVYFGVRTLQDKSDLRAECPVYCTPSTLAGGNHDYSDAQTSSTISTVAIGVGAAMVVGGGVWWFFDQRSRSRAALEWAPAVGPGVAGLVVRGSI